MSVTHYIAKPRLAFDYMLRRRFGQGVSDIEQELATVGHDAALAKFQSICIGGEWHRVEHERFASEFSGAQKRGFRLRYLLARVNYLLGCRQRFFDNQPTLSRLHLNSASERRAYALGKLKSASLADDNNAEKRFCLLSQMVYRSRRQSNPFIHTSYLAGLFAPWLGEERDLEAALQESTK